MEERERKEEERKRKGKKLFLTSVYLFDAEGLHVVLALTSS
jgi:hypothetical protein